VFAWLRGCRPGALSSGRRPNVIEGSSPSNTPPVDFARVPAATIRSPPGAPHERGGRSAGGAI
jgi:hypothetical protein